VIDLELIKKYFYSSNYLTLSMMYLNKYKHYDNLTIDDLKKYNPGHLGSSLNINFILANLLYFFNSNHLSSKFVIGTGHSGVSLIANQWLNGTLSEYYAEYDITLEGLNNLINDFGISIRSEINPKYPETIYDGGELGYSLGVSYGYATSCCNVDYVPCIIGDGEAETGTLASSWYLNRLLKTKSKVLPIINLNGFKMGSASYFSKLSKDDLNKYFDSLGYDMFYLDVSNDLSIEDSIISMQNILCKVVLSSNPLIVFKAPKGFTIPKVDDFDIENNTISHKNPFADINDINLKLHYLKNILSKYDNIFFSNDGCLDNNFIDKFRVFSVNDISLNINRCLYDCDAGSVINVLENYFVNFLKNNKDVLIFSPDEIYSNKLGKVASYGCFEMLNENVLQALMQGVVQAGNIGIFVGYEGFMPIVSSMVSQYYKYLKQKDVILLDKDLNSVNYILTSIAWENTYSHQNPGFVDELLLKDDKYYNILYPKDSIDLLKCLDKYLYNKNCINVITLGKRCDAKYDNIGDDLDIQIIKDNLNPDLILCATGDYMLKQVMEVYKKFSNEHSNIKVKVIYVTNPSVLSNYSKNSLSSIEFSKYFDENIPVVYLFSGYSGIIKSLLYDRKKYFSVYGYNDGVSCFGSLENNLNSNGLSVNDIYDICYNNINKKVKRRIKVRKSEK